MRFWLSLEVLANGGSGVTWLTRILIVMKTSAFTIISPARHQLGEGIFVDDQVVTWVDIDTDELFVLTPERETKRYGVPVKPSVVLHRTNSSLVVGCDTGLCEFDLETQKMRDLASFPHEFDAIHFRSNDGCRLPDGRFLLGTMHRQYPEKFSGEIYLFDSGERGRALGVPVNIPNGFVVSANGGILVADSHSGHIDRLEFDRFGRCKIAARWNHKLSSSGTPDGACSLPDGSVLFAYWGGGKLVQFSSNGRKIDEIEVPVPRPSNCKYRKSDGRLYVTSAGASTGTAASQADLSGHTLSCSVVFN